MIWLSKPLGAVRQSRRFSPFFPAALLFEPLRLPHQLRQLRDIRRDPPRFSVRQRFEIDCLLPKSQRTYGQEFKVREASLKKGASNVH
jgi:hypothetical protein